MRKIPNIKIEFLEQRTIYHRQSNHLSPEETFLSFTTVDVPLGSEGYPLSGDLTRTEEGKKWLKMYQAYYRKKYNGREFVPQELYATLTQLPFRKLRYFADPLSFFIVPQERSSREKDSQSRARIVSLDESLAALVDITFAKRAAGHEADILHFHEIRRYVRDAQGIMQKYHIDTVADTDDRYHSLLGKLFRKHIKPGLNCVDRFNGWGERNPVWKLATPIDHTIELAMNPLRRSKDDHIPVIRLKFVPAE